MLVLCAFFNVSCLGTDASDQVENNSFGLRIVAVSGNGQIGPPDELFEDPAVIQVIDSAGEGVSGIDITFNQISGSLLFITNPATSTDGAGLAKTSVRSPIEGAQSGTIEACISGSRSCVTFEFSSDTTSENIKFQLISENSGVETAGQAFSLQVRTVDSSSEVLVDFNGSINLEWTFITNDSWAGFSPNLLPAVTSCTFVAGICDVSQQVTLTDARQITRVFLGDGDAGFIDVFGQVITVNADVASLVVVTDAPGGPLAGANTIQDTVFTADDPDQIFYAAVTDAVGNYINDATTVTWSSSHPTQMTANLSTLSGTSTLLDFTESIPFPAFGYIFATVPGFPTGSSGQISIDPGVPVNAQTVPVDGNWTRVGGEEFEFDVQILDANGNLYGQQFGSTGYTGTFPVTFTFSNYQTGPIPSGGVLPMIHTPGQYDQTAVSRTLSIPFFGGKAQFLSYRMTFFDATSVTPEVNASVNASTDPSLPDVSGDVTYSMTVGPPDHLMLRDGLGSSADSLCPADYTSASLFQWTRLDFILQFDYQDTNKETCSGINVDSGDPARNIYMSIEDKGGNFIANVNVDWIYTDLANTDSLLETQMTGASPSNTQTFTPDVATGNVADQEWIRVQGTYNTVFYDQYFRGRVLPGNLFAFDVKIRRSPATFPDWQAVADVSQTLVVVPLDEQGNELTNSFSRDLDISLSGTFSNSPDGTPPVFLSTGTHPSVPFQRLIPDVNNDNVNRTTAVATFTGLYTPRVGDVITITVTDSLNPSITDSVNWTVVPGEVRRAEIWKDGFPGSGTEVTGSTFSISTDDSTDLYAVAKDSEGNPITVSSSWVTWNDTAQPFAPAGAVTGILSGTVQTPFNPQLPGTGRMYLNINQNPGGSATATTGLITIDPGAPASVDVAIDTTSFPAGQARVVTASIEDAKGNVVSSINGPVNLAVNVLNNSLTRLNFSQIAPSSGNYSFTNGRYVFSGAEGFTFYNSNENPTIQIATTDGSPVVGQSPLLTINPEAFDHLALLSANTQVDAGVVNRYTVVSEDIYGNRLNTGPESSKTVTFNITSSLGNEDITGSDLVSSSIGNYSLPGQTTVAGNLTNGAAYVDVMTTKSGTMTVSGSTTGIIGTNTEEPLTVLPLTTISYIRFKPGEEPNSPSTTISNLLPFSVELMDAFDNVITNNNTEIVELSLIGATQSFGNYLPKIAVNGESVFSGLRYTLADSFTIRAFLSSDPGKFVEAPMVVENGSVTRTVVVLPDQTFTEGTGTLASAITGIPFSGTATRTAGDTFNVDVRAVDSSYNTVNTYTGLVSLSSTDPYLEVTPASQNFVAGVATFNVKVRKQGALHNISAVTGFTNHPSTDYAVNYNTATQLIVLLPGQDLLEGAPDLSTAVDLLVPDQTAGSPFSVEVRALDDYFNLVDNYSHGDIALSLDTDPSGTAPANASMSLGRVIFSTTNFLAIPGHTLTPSTASGASLTSQTSETYEVKPNVATQYIAVLPGQSYLPGQAPGDYASAVTGSPTDQDTDGGFSVNLYAVDNYFNVRQDHNSAVSIATPGDPTDTEPAAGAFANGAVTFTVNPVTAAPAQSISVTSSLLPNPPAAYNINPGAPAQLIAIFTDYQTLIEGNTSLISAVANQTVQNRVSGESVAVRIYSTDNNYNIVDDDATTVSLGVSTPNSSVAPTSQSLTNGEADFTLETYLVGSNYNVTPSGGAYAQNNSTLYNVTLGPGKRLLLVLPNQVFAPGQATAAAAAAGSPHEQTQGSDFPFTATVFSTDDYFNPRTTDTDTVTIVPSLAASVSGGTSQTMTAGQASFNLYHTSSGNAENIQATAGGFTSGTSKTYDVNVPLTDPTLALSDPNTSDTTSIRQATVETTIGNDASASRWCVSESQSTRPTAGTNGRSPCTGGAGSDNGWYTSRPTSVSTTGTPGSKTLYVWLSDDAFNVSVNSGSDSITLDSLKPDDPAGLSLSDQSSLSTSYTNAALVDLDVTLSGDTVDWCVIEQPLANPPPTAPLYNNVCWNTKPGVLPTPYTLAATGNRAVYIFAKDAAHNVSTSYASASITYDNAAPVFPGGNDITGVLGGTDAVADNWLGTTLVPTLEWQAATDASPVTYTLTLREGGTPICGSPVTALSGTSHTFTGCNLTHGNTYTVNLTAYDSAEQSTVADNDGFSFTVDNVAPTTFTVNGMDGGADSSADAYLTASLTNPKANWNDSTGETGYEVYITNNAGTFTECGVDTATQDATNYQSFSGCNLSDNTDYKLRVVAYDQAGNQREASNSPFNFRTTQGIDHFLVELVPGTDPSAGTGFAVKLTAQRANNETLSSYTGVKTIQWTTNAGTGVDVCNTASNMAPEFASTSLNFTTGIATTTSAFKMKVVQTNRTITATEQDTGDNATGTSSGFAVTAATLNCVRIEDTAGGAGSPLGPESVSVDTSVTAHAAGYDIYGNFLSDQSVTWSATGVIAGNFYPLTGTSTNLVTTEAGSGQLIATGASVDGANFTVSTGNTLLTTATTDVDGNSHLGSNSVQAVYYWNVENDAVTAWMTDSGLSWHSEATSSHRGARDDFPPRVHLVASSSGLDIIDATSNNLFMRFVAGSNSALDSDLGNTVDVTALNGKIFLTMDDGGSTGGLIIIDLAGDQVFQINSTQRQISGNTLDARNSAATWSADTTYPLLGSSRMNKITSRRISGNDYVVIGENNGVEVLKVSSPTSVYRDTTANPVFAVAFDSSSRIYFGEDSVGLHRTALSLPLSGNFSPDVTYTRSTNAELISASINDISVAEGASGVDAGQNTLLIASDIGLTTIQEHATFGSSASASHTTLGTGNNAFAGSLGLNGTDGYMSLADGAGLSGTATFELWFRPSSNPANTVLLQKGSGSDGSVDLSFDGAGFLEFSVVHNSSTFSVTSTSNSWSNNRWYHIAATISPSQISLWTDGSDRQTNSSMNFALPSPYSVSSAALTIGGTSGGANFHGLIDELRVSDNLRYSTASFTVPTSAFTSDGNTEHLLHFNETSGGTASYSDTGAQVNGALFNSSYFIKPLFSGSSESLSNLSSHYSGGRISTHIATGSGWSEILDLQGGSPYENVSDQSAACFDVDIYHITNSTDHDVVLGRSSSGLQLRRR